MRIWGLSQSFLERFIKSLTKRYIFQLEIRALAKVLILTTGIFSAWSLNKFFNFFKMNNLFPECSKKDQTYISDILTLFEYVLRIKIKKCENEDDLDLFLNGSNFTRNKIIINYFINHKVMLYSPESISFNSQSINIGALAKVLILTTRIFNNFSLNAPNFRRL